MIIGHFGVGARNSKSIGGVRVGILLNKFSHILDRVEKHLLLIVVFAHNNNNNK